MFAEAARRFLILLAGVGGVTVVLSAALGALAGTSIRRAVAVGCYFAGALLLLSGFFLGNKGVLRAEADPAEAGRNLPMLRPRRIRSATSEEQREAVSVAALVMTLGIVLILVGVLADDENEFIRS